MIKFMIIIFFKYFRIKSFDNKLNLPFCMQIPSKPVFERPVCAKDVSAKAVHSRKYVSSISIHASIFPKFFRKFLKIWRLKTGKYEKGFRNWINLDPVGGWGRVGGHFHSKRLDRRILIILHGLVYFSTWVLELSTLFENNKFGFKVFKIHEFFRK